MRRFAMMFLVLGATTVGRADEPEQARGITEISLRRTMCYGPCPVDQVVLRSDGTATYTGTSDVARLGTYEGKFSRWQFKRLAELLESRDFFKMRGRYLEPVPDQASVITRAVRGGKEKVVDNYAGAGPIELWGIKMAIRGVVAEIEWKKK